MWWGADVAEGRLRAYLTFGATCLRLSAAERGRVLLFVALSVLSALTEGVGVSLMLPILGAAQSQESFSSVPVLGRVADMFDSFPQGQRFQAVAAAMLVVVVLKGVLQYAVNFYGAWIPIRLHRLLAKRSYQALLGVEIGYLNDNEYGVLFNGLSGWVARAAEVLTAVATILWSGLVLLVYLGLMLAMSWQTMLVAGATLGAISYGVRRLTTRPLHRAGVDLDAAEAGLNQLIMETLTGMKLIRLTASEQVMMRAHDAKISTWVEFRRRWFSQQQRVAPLMSTATGIFICALLILSQWSTETPNSPATISQLLLFLFVLFRALGPVTMINDARSRIVGNLHAFNLLDRFYEETEKRRQPSGSADVQPLRHEIRLEAIRFAYGPAGRTILSELDLIIQRGEMVAVVGPSGAGKTTLINLLMRLYEPQAGRILVDGTDLRDLDVRQWRRRVAVVSQDIFLFNDTVAANIAFGRSADADEIRAAARLASAEDFIEALPQGFDTMLGDRGLRLSGGQQQRIAIARAVLCNPDLLILDEATSNLDTVTERAIGQAVDHLRRDRTMIVIAHRLSTIRRADRVVVMSEGRVVEQGTHQALMARGGVYREMVEHQALDLIDDENDPEAKVSP